MFTRDQIADALRSRYPIVQQTGDWRPLAQYVVDVVELAVKDEREACAQVADSFCDTGKRPVRGIYAIRTAHTERIAAAIRARGKPS